MLAQLAPWYTLYIFVEILSGALRGLGDVFIPTVLTLFGVCFLRILWVIGAIRLQPTITAIIYGYPVTWGITAISFIIYYLYRIRRVQASFYAS